MLTPEQARELLAQHRIGEVEKQQLEAIAKLDTHLRPAAYALINRDANGKSILGQSTYWQQIHQLGLSLHALDEFDSTGRAAIFQLFFPTLTPYIEQAWQWLQHVPYQRGYVRKAFRAPHRQDLTLNTQVNWLKEMVTLLGGYHEDIQWVATYGAYLAPYTHTLGLLFAAVLDTGNDESDAIYDILLASARGDHEIGAMGRHVIYGLLCASRPEGWAFIENMLLAAQREEGLRQSILEAIDEAHPTAFQRMLHLIIEHNLTRFSSVVRAVNVWVGYGWDADNARAVNQTIEQILTMFEAPAACDKVLALGDGEGVYLALWSLAYHDIMRAIPQATDLLGDKNVERRFAAVHLLAQLDVPDSQLALLPALDDPDVRVVLRACEALQHPQLPSDNDLFERIERVTNRLAPKQRLRRQIIWPWMQVGMEKSAVAEILLKCQGDRSPKRLIPYIGVFDTSDRLEAAERLARVTPWNDEIRQTLFALVGDLSPYVRERMLKILDEQDLPPTDAPTLEALLTRKSSDLRRGVLSLLAKQPDQHAFASAERLMASRDLLQRHAGLELLRLLSEEERDLQRCRALASSYHAEHHPLNETEDVHVRFILGEPAASPTLDDALGLLNPEERTRPQPPPKQPVALTSQAAHDLLQSLDTLIHQHRAETIPLNNQPGTREVLLGNAYLPGIRPDLPDEENLSRLPLCGLWEQWWADRPASLRDPDSLELVRALLMLYGPNQGFIRPQEAVQHILPLYVHRAPHLNYLHQLRTLIEWLIWLHPPRGGADFFLNALEAVAVTLWDYLGSSQELREHWRENLRFIHIMTHECRVGFHHSWEDQHDVRLWRFYRWLDEPASDLWRSRPPFDILLRAYRVGAATDADILDHLLGPRGAEQGGYGFPDLRVLSGPHPHPLVKELPILGELVERCRQRILAIELERGDMPTIVSSAALALRSVSGADLFIRLVKMLGRSAPVRVVSFDHLSKFRVFSHLILVSMPLKEDTPEAFADMVQAARISEKQLVQVAVYAPQWAELIEYTLGWPCFTDAVWWLHAHTKDHTWRVDPEIRAEWVAQIAERTPLEAQDLLEGAVDVGWFERVYTVLGVERWETLCDAAKYSSDGSGHERALLFANAMSGKLDKNTVIERMLKKRHQDSVRALGLIPLSGKNDILERYQALQEMLRTSRKYGSMRRANEKLAAQIGMENLARTAGYPDPVRLQWAMEAEEISDLRNGPVVVTVDSVSVALAIDSLGNPTISIERDGKPLKNVPAQYRKHADVKALHERKKSVTEQASRMRRSLEQAMCRGDEFSGDEITTLLTHPVLAPMLEALILVGDGLMGYPVESGHALLRYDGATQPITASTLLRIVHPHDLLITDEWHLWQRGCFLAEYIQPFKQVFRELYVLTEAENQEGTISRRYAGHQVQPNQAVALLGSRGWVTHPGEGVSRTFHDEQISAHLTFLQAFYTPADMEGLTLEDVIFTRPGSWKPLPLIDIPPRMFSEVMRDLDLVVSVAHRGGIDPESSASTIDMRAALIRETCALLKIENVNLKGHHVLIEGQLGSYSVHLGSAVVHRQPGGALCIIPVHAQHRGRLFLPFADDDPKTAEVVSKTLLLARDQMIKDPTILDQIQAVR